MRESVGRANIGDPTEVSLWLVDSRRTRWNRSPAAGSMLLWLLVLEYVDFSKIAADAEGMISIAKERKDFVNIDHGTKSSS